MKKLNFYQVKKYFYKNLNKDIKYIVNDYIKHIISNYKTLDISI